MSNHEGAWCPYDEHAPRTLEGWQAWELLCDGGGQLRTAGNGTVIGFDIPALLELAEARGFNLQIVACLLPYAEAGVIAALAPTRTGDG